MKEREQFGSRLGFILVSAGCAIGLGNVWKFPYICGMYGGAAFILIYLLFLAILGAPILACEIAVGRGSGRGIARAFDELEQKGEKWHHVKWFGIAGNYLLMMYYTMVCGWLLNYAWKSMKGSLSGLNPQEVTGVFSDMLSSGGEMMFWTIATIALSFGICALGLKGGVEKVTKGMMCILIMLMVVLGINSLTLDGAGEGIRFYLIPDFAKVKEAGVGTVIFAAMSQAFFTLSIGIGSMQIFGSYLSKDRAITGEALSIVAVDTFVALMAGFIVLPACFAFGQNPKAGPSLLFETLPNVFNDMDGGRIWGVAFFVFMSFAALSTVIAVFENIIAFFMDGFGWERKKAVIVNLILLTVLSAPAVLGYNVWSGVEPLGAGTTIMDFEDFIVSNNLLPLGSLVFVLFVTRKNGWGFENFLKEVNTGNGMRFPKAIRGYMTYVLPVVICVVYLKGYYDFFAGKDVSKMIMAAWMTFAVVLLVAILLIAFGLCNRKKKDVQ